MNGQKDWLAEQISNRHTVLQGRGFERLQKCSEKGTNRSSQNLSPKGKGSGERKCYFDRHVILQLLRGIQPFCISLGFLIYMGNVWIYLMSHVLLVKPSGCPPYWQKHLT